jgi:hypothetical protein
MLQQENQTQSANFEWVCQALSATGEPCDTSATCHCGVCIVGSGSAHSTPKTNRGIAALSSQVKRVVKDNNWNWQLSAPPVVSLAFKSAQTTCASSVQ